MLALKGEAVLGAQLVVRHRAVRLTALLSLAILVLALAQGGPGSPHTLFGVGGCLSAVAGSRLLAPGAALAAARRAAGPWWLAPAGRLAGLLLLLAPVLAVGAAALIPSSGGEAAFVPLALAALLQAGALGALTLALAPAVGASASGMLGLTWALLGGLRPSEMLQLLAGWPYAQRVAVTAWNLLPLSWRAARWLRDGTPLDLVLLGSWVVAGTALGAWATALEGGGDRRSGRWP
ncbi:MAG: hypothetical protein JSW43_03475 [Gemmatimonadota bacterium]|nr:MAG: hypothetical protein JSW43_03475 [Gemmatimonadota bacterium]